MRVLLILVVSLFISQLFVFAQNSIEKVGCPIFSVSGPSAAVDYDKPIEFRLDIDRKLYPNTKINWTVSHGKILSGQGTNFIEVENLSNIGITATATAEISGLPENCEKTASASAPTVCGVFPEAMKVDEFAKVTKNILKEKISNLSKKLKDDPSATTTIVKSFAKNTNKLTDYSYLQLILNYLKADGINEERIDFQLTSENREQTELWFVPAGAALPNFDAEFERFDASKLNRRITAVSKKR